MARSNTPEYDAWANMKYRCVKKDHDSYHNYGARGIRVCLRWQESFANFLQDMGPRPSPKHSLDRIDNDGNYEPGNCRWATRDEQCANRSSNIMVPDGREMVTVTEYCRRRGLIPQTIYNRLNRGWPLSEVLSPVRKRGTKLTLKQVIAIYTRIHAGESHAALEREFGVTHTTVYDIKNRRVWRAATQHLAEV